MARATDIQRIKADTDQAIGKVTLLKRRDAELSILEKTQIGAFNRTLYADEGWDKNDLCIFEMQPNNVTSLVDKVVLQVATSTRDIIFSQEPYSLSQLCRALIIAKDYQRLGDLCKIIYHSDESAKRLINIFLTILVGSQQQTFADCQPKETKPKVQAVFAVKETTTDNNQNLQQLLDNISKQLSAKSNKNNPESAKQLFIFTLSCALSMAKEDAIDIIIMHVTNAEQAVSRQLKQAMANFVQREHTIASIVPQCLSGYAKICYASEVRFYRRRHFKKLATILWQSVKSAQETSEPTITAEFVHHHLGDFDSSNYRSFQKYLNAQRLAARGNEEVNHAEVLKILPIPPWQDNIKRAVEQRDNNPWPKIRDALDTIYRPWFLIELFHYGCGWCGYPNYAHERYYAGLKLALTHALTLDEWKAIDAIGQHAKRFTVLFSDRRAQRAAQDVIENRYETVTVENLPAFIALLGAANRKLNTTNEDFAKLATVLANSPSDLDKQIRANYQTFLKQQLDEKKLISFKKYLARQISTNDITAQKAQIVLTSLSPDNQQATASSQRQSSAATTAPIPAPSPENPAKTRSSEELEKSARDDKPFSKQRGLGFDCQLLRVLRVLISKRSKLTSEALNKHNKTAEGTDSVSRFPQANGMQGDTLLPVERNSRESNPSSDHLARKTDAPARSSSGSSCDPPYHYAATLTTLGLLSGPRDTGSYVRQAYSDNSSSTPSL